MKKLLVLVGLIVLVGCATTQQRTTYNTLYSVEQTAMTSYDAYLDLVVKGKVATNDVPRVSRAFDAFQAQMQFAVKQSQYNWTNIAPADVTSALSNLVWTIQTAK